MNKNLNDLNFKSFVFFKTISLLVVTIASKIFVSYPKIYEYSELSLHININLLILVTLATVSIALFINDYQMLIEKKAYCPSWLWVLIPIVYVYKRQKNNTQGMGMFWWYIAVNWVLGAIVLVSAGNTIRVMEGDVGEPVWTLLSYIT